MHSLYEQCHLSRHFPAPSKVVRAIRNFLAGSSVFSLASLQPPARPSWTHFIPFLPAYFPGANTLSNSHLDVPPLTKEP